MVFLSKLIQVQKRKFHTFHFKFKFNFELGRIFYTTSNQLLKHKTQQKLNSSFYRNSGRNLFNIGQFMSCRMGSCNPIVIEPSSTHKATLLFFHGLGDTGAGWADYWECLGIPGLKVVLPTAPSQKVTLNLGMKMPSWFDIYGLSEDSKEDEEGIKKAAESVHNLIEEEISKTNLSRDRIYLAGFSQGGALAIYSALTYPEKLAGCILYSCWLPLHKNISDKLCEENRNINILQCHGDSDFVVPLRWGQMTQEFLKNQIKNENVQFKVYSGMAHGGCAEETKDTKEYLTNLLSKI